MKEYYNGINKHFELIFENFPTLAMFKFTKLTRHWWTEYSFKIFFFTGANKIVNVT